MLYFILDTRKTSTGTREADSNVVDKDSIVITVVVKQRWPDRTDLYHNTYSVEKARLSKVQTVNGIQPDATIAPGNILTLDCRRQLRDLTSLQRKQSDPPGGQTSKQKLGLLQPCVCSFH